MEIRRREYPYPVLSYFSDDLIKCAFQASFSPSSTRNSYILEVKFHTSNADLLELISHKKAVYGLHIECPATRYRALVKSENEDLIHEIDSSRLDGRVQICTLIIASEAIPSYQNASFHPDYEGGTFPIGKGDVLAVAPDILFFAEKDYDPLRKIPSIFSVKQNKAADPPAFDVDLSGNYKVLIYLAPENWTRFQRISLNQNLHTTLSSVFIIPALVSVLESIRNGGAEEFEDRHWFRVLANKLKEQGIDATNPDTLIESSLTVAQKLIGDPVSNSLKALEEFEVDE